MIPQKRSYFALELSHGWWLLAFDLSLSQDIDIEQFKYFVGIAQFKSVEAVITVNHEPSWVLDYEMKLSPDNLTEPNLRELLEVHFAGKVRLRLAGDLHHYTRHVPMRPLSEHPNTSTNMESPSSSAPTTFPQSIQRLTSRTVSDAPELIVSGGGGAFLHATHTFSRLIKVGSEQQKYMRVCAFPSERVSYHLSWLNIWQFRWRNWRIDLMWAVSYVCMASSLFPLCGIYEDFVSINPTHDPMQLTLAQLASWVVRKMYLLFLEIFRTGRISAIVVIGAMAATYCATDSKIAPGWRFLWGCGHGLVHVLTALFCLLFIQCITEWSIYDGIVHVDKTSAFVPQVAKDTGVDLASSMYEEYTAHFLQFYKWIQNVSPSFYINSATCETADQLGDGLEKESQFERLHTTLLEGVKSVVLSFNQFPLLRTAMSIFDLPGQIAQKHSDICEVLCRDGKECMISTNVANYQLLDRATLVSYVAAISLYFACLAIPLAGNVMGTWLALTLTWFRAQYNEGFSSLRMPHWKNFVRLHIQENGDLEVFAIGLQRVPKRWMKDPRWDGSKVAKRRRQEEHLLDKQQRDRTYAIDADAPSWTWERPSKWIPKGNSKRYTPQLIDYTCIPKRDVRLDREHRQEQFPLRRTRSRSFESYTRVNKNSFERPRIALR